MRTFRLIERDLEDGRREIRVEGELDLAACEFIDSTGIAVIVQASKAAAENGRRVILHSPTAQVLRVLTITGLIANGLVFASREEASSRFPSPG